MSEKKNGQGDAKKLNINFKSYLAQEFIQICSLITIQRTMDIIVICFISFCHI